METKQPTGSQAVAAAAAAAAASRKRALQGSQSVNAAQPMSHISGVKKPLQHWNSIQADKIPKYAVETPNEEELGEVMCPERSGIVVI